ncbi:Ribosome production factor 2 -like protein [Capsicum baccatum]|uniref:Ribosome production factor 2-like protein n=1 Tax=Capsicum baccatum TaxID=33114 RepID=A0A2G2XMW3_CAPBA|nr:Ribosome production factor 2 -like protein [Capsicum baccatum]
MQVVTNLNLDGLDRVYVCAAVSPNRVFFTHCALHLKKSGAVVPRIKLVEVGPSRDLVTRRHRLSEDSLRKESMKTTLEKAKKKVGSVALPYKAKGVKRKCREAKLKHGTIELSEEKKQKLDSDSE